MLIIRWLRSSLWLQFKPHQIAAGAAYLAARSLNMDLTSCQNVWQEFYTPPSVLRGICCSAVDGAVLDDNLEDGQI
ncbi:putative Cyclin-like superfamily, cyclin/Cyclin-like subunit Ssn8 [Helianthus anomalus]